MDNDDIGLLFFFDFVFVFDRSIDLFVGWNDDTIQLNLFTVINKNLTFIYFIELFTALSPGVLIRINKYICRSNV